MSDYPQTVIEVLQPSMQFPLVVIETLRSFAQRGPWSGTIDERKQKFRSLNAALARACGIPKPELVFHGLNGRNSRFSYYAPSQHRIALVGRLSVITYLHEFAHACGLGERGACAWSINLFRQVFPRQFGRLVHRGHLLVRPRDAPLVRHHTGNSGKDRRHAVGRT
jgi:hypothetical protein